MDTLASFKLKKGRDKLFIISSILNIARDGTMKTQIMYQANLSFTQLNDYLRFMLRIDLLQKVSIGRKETYKSTSKGLDFLQRYNEIQEVIKTEELFEHERQSRLPKIRRELGELRKAIDILETDLFNTVNCPKCQASVFPDYRYCPYCGTWLYIEAVKKGAE
jgi:predicted transcriptional regulator